MKTRIKEHQCHVNIRASSTECDKKDKIASILKSEHNLEGFRINDIWNKFLNFNLFENTG